MRVLFVTPYYRPAHLGGIERAIERLAAALRGRPDVQRLGVLTTPYAFPPRFVAGLSRHEVLDGGLEVYRLPSWPRTPAPLFPAYSCPVTFFAPRDIRAVLRSFRPDVIHLVGDGWIWVHLWLIVHRTPSMAVVFTPSFHDLAGTRAWLRLPNTLLARHAERTVVLTEHERRRVSAAYRPPPERIVTVPWGVTLPAATTLAPAPARAEGAPLTILCVGRLGDHKGQLRLLAAYARARPSWHRPTRLVFVGKDEGGPGGQAALMAGIAREGLEGDVTLTGEVDDATLDRLYGDADIFALFSHYEAFGLVFLEAMAHGVPVLTHRVGANADVLTGGAVLTEPYDVATAAAALARLVNDDEERRRLGAAARALVATTFSWDTVASRYQAVYDAAVAVRHGRTVPCTRGGGRCEHERG